MYPIETGHESIITTQTHTCILIFIKVSITILKDFCWDQVVCGLLRCKFKHSFPIYYLVCKLVSIMKISEKMHAWR